MRPVDLREGEARSATRSQRYVTVTFIASAEEAFEEDEVRDGGVPVRVPGRS